MDVGDRVLGSLIGVALGDAVGLPFEGLSMKRVQRRFDGAVRCQLVGRIGFVSDDTEQSALVAQSLARGGSDDAACVGWFRRSMVGWFARLPFGIGGATLRSCVRMTLGFRSPGVRSAGNGAAMRAGILGAHLAFDAARRRRLGRLLASLTHTDERAIQAALYVAELTAHAITSESSSTDRVRLVARAREVVEDPQLLEAIDGGLALAKRHAPLTSAVGALGNTGFVVHSIGLCTYCFVLFGGEPTTAIAAAIRAGGDTDTHAAIVGGWMGALVGARRLPQRLIEDLHDGPFGPSHLRGLAAALISGRAPPRWSWSGAMIRNLALYPVVLAHGVARLWPW